MRSVWTASSAMPQSSPGTTKSLRHIFFHLVIPDWTRCIIQHVINLYLFVCWFFQVKYECLSDEIKIGDYYLRLLLEEDENEESSAIKRS